MCQHIPEKQSAEYVRILNVSDAVHSIRSLYKLLTSYWDRHICYEALQENILEFFLLDTQTRSAQYAWICLNISQYVWTWLNIPEHPWICLNNLLYASVLNILQYSHNIIIFVTNIMTLEFLIAQFFGCTSRH